jgi:hypothetical protein
VVLKRHHGLCAGLACSARMDGSEWRHGWLPPRAGSGAGALPGRELSARCRTFRPDAGAGPRLLLERVWRGPDAPPGRRCTFCLCASAGGRATAPRRHRGAWARSARSAPPATTTAVRWIMPALASAGR